MTQSLFSVAKALGAFLRRPEKGIFDNIAQVHAPAAGSHTPYELTRRPFRLGDRCEDSMLHGISLTFMATMTNRSESASIVSDNARSSTLPTWHMPVVIVGLPAWWLAIRFGLLFAIINMPIVEKSVAHVAAMPA